LSPTTKGPWKSKILHNFGADAADGAVPNGLIFDSAGNLYGTTANGGTGSGCNVAYGCGTVFELIPESGGAWKEKILYNFNGTDGANPVASLVLDSAGNLYGTTYNGGAYGWGCVFELSPQSGSWNETVLFSFDGNDNGSWPEGDLVFDASGNLYGTTSFGGSDGKGEVFELSPQAGGGWTETVIYSFDASKYGNGDGEQPAAGVTFDPAGNLYGTTVYGGIHSGGTVFELSPAAGGGWTETVLHSFQNYSVDSGIQPRGNVILDATGNLYSTLSNGGHYSRGSVFEILH
jgi:uncharacterized repeat protein (TIGR03803 family)